MPAPTTHGGATASSRRASTADSSHGPARGTSSSTRSSIACAIWRARSAAVASNLRQSHRRYDMTVKQPTAERNLDGYGFPPIEWERVRTALDAVAARSPMEPSTRYWLG